ncbi:C-5 cytosine-specific DNA methylase [Pseudobutyrivibrio sp. C4]|nr:C-5 cytosine-specific DNA methylase [Pseudobutyrivibrio sp. C4]
MLGCMDGSFEIINRVYSTDGIAPTINTCGGGGREPKIMEKQTVKIKQATKKGYIECEVGGVADLSFPDSKTRRGRVVDNGNTCPTIQCENDICRIEKAEHYRIRKLTPKECFRLMGFDDEDFEAAAEENTNTQLYKQAGNSIVVDVLENIFKEML